MENNQIKIVEEITKELEKVEEKWEYNLEEIRDSIRLKNYQELLSKSENRRQIRYIEDLLNKTKI